MKSDFQSHKHFISVCIDSALHGVENGDGGPFGAIVVKDGKIIAKAHNEVLKTKDPTMHAEVNAIRKASKKLGTYDLSGCELYTTCMPCPMCLGAIMWSNIEKVYYGATSSDAENIGFRDKQFYDAELATKDNGKLINVFRDECLKPFVAWQNKKDKSMY